MATTAPADPVEQALDTDQEQLGGSDACAVVALYWSLMMLQEPADLKRTDVLRFLRQGCVEWQIANMPPLMHLLDVLTRLPGFAPLLRLEEDHQFLMMTPRAESISVDTRPADMPTLRQTLEQLRARVTSRGRQLACVFTRGLYTMVFRMAPNGPHQIRVDMLESHGKRCLPSQRVPGASWVQCFSVDQLMHYLELYYPSYDEQVVMPHPALPLAVVKPHPAMGSITVLDLVPHLTPTEQSAY